MSDLLSQLQDIEGIGHINWWPLGPGWWVLLGVAILLGGGWYFYRADRKRKARRWQRAILDHLSFLEKNLSQDTAQSTLIEISELIRRIAIHQSSRTECAGLEGMAWLTWLAEHDPHHFDWKAQEHLWIDLPYAPAGTPVPLQDLRCALQAIKGWVK